ncbi:hydrogenase 3 maturation endopeptidase HyCI [Methanogenium cariaci]|uniref:hydrogenase 3 maturation endopeptidase HyCI n=1 Tax=Methanogenium cariaci TaxID=2197 RepID=UPI0012F7043A|nr:hydrogenase 3 maturation endopeptidase HyCI [Methanogenium cariaci]
MLFGVGNTMLGDDGIGPPRVAERMNGCPPGWHAADCGTAPPENFTGVVRKMRPRILVIVDAADMRLSPPGEFRRIHPDAVGQAGFDTHSLPPLTHIIEYLRETVPKMPEIMLIGIQPGGPVTFHEEISAPVIRGGGDEVAEMLRNGEEGGRIPAYIPDNPE